MDQSTKECRNAFNQLLIAHQSNKNCIAEVCSRILDHDWHCCNHVVADAFRFMADVMDEGEIVPLSNSRYKFMIDDEMVADTHAKIAPSKVPWRSCNSHGRSHRRWRHSKEDQFDAHAEEYDDKNFEVQNEELDCEDYSDDDYEEVSAPGREEQMLLEMMKDLSSPAVAAAFAANMNMTLEVGQDRHQFAITKAFQEKMQQQAQLKTRVKAPVAVSQKEALVASATKKAVPQSQKVKVVQPTPSVSPAVKPEAKPMSQKFDTQKRTDSKISSKSAQVVMKENQAPVVQSLKRQKTPTGLFMFGADADKNPFLSINTRKALGVPEALSSMKQEPPVVQKPVAAVRTQSSFENNLKGIFSGSGK